MNQSARIASIVVVVCCVLAVIAEFFIERHPHFSFEGVPAFYALFGFIAYCVIVLGAKSLRRFLNRPESYYEDSSND